MRAYVSIRGSRSPRSVSRDATPTGQNHFPYAALHVEPDSGRLAATYELSYINEPERGRVRVELTRHTPTAGTVKVYVGFVTGENVR